MDSEPNRSGYVEQNGIQVYYEYYGDGDRPALVIQNGVAMETASWHRYLPLFQEHMDVLLWDFRGQGKSTSDDNPYSIEELADFLKLIIETVGLRPERVNLLGVSTGSFVVAEFLRKYSASVRRAVISGALLTEEPTFRAQVELSKKVLERRELDVCIDALYMLLFSGGFMRQIADYIPKMKEALYHRYENRIPALWQLMEMQVKLIENIDAYHSAYGQVQTPIRLIVGEHDLLTPPFVQEKICRIFPNVEYFTFPECGHIPLMEDTQSFARHLNEFLLQ